MSLKPDLHPAGQQVGSTWVRIALTAMITVRLASTANIADLSAVSTSLDGATIAEGDLVLLKDQSTGSQNLLYVASDLDGSTCVLSRIDPFATGAPVFPGQGFFVAAGSVNGGKTFQVTNSSAKVVGTDAITLAEASDAANAAGVPITDAGGFTSQTTVEGALQELYQDALSIQACIPINVYSFREVSAGGDVGNVAANGGILASDTTPIMRGDASSSAEISWATGDVDAIGTSFSLPPDLDDTANVSLELEVASGSTDAATMGVATSWNGGSEVTDSADDSGTKSATPHTITATIAAADVPASAKRLTIRLTPPTHGSDAISLYSARLLYKRKLRTS